MGMKGNPVFRKVRLNRNYSPLGPCTQVFLLMVCRQDIPTQCVAYASGTALQRPSVKVVIFHGLCLVS